VLGSSGASALCGADDFLLSRSRDGHLPSPGASAKQYVPRFFLVVDEPFLSLQQRLQEPAQAFSLSVPKTSYSLQGESSRDPSIGFGLPFFLFLHSVLSPMVR